MTNFVPEALAMVAISSDLVVWLKQAVTFNMYIFFPPTTTLAVIHFRVSASVISIRSISIICIEEKKLQFSEHLCLFFLSFHRLTLRRHDDRGVSRAAWREPGGGGAVWGLRPLSGWWHHWGGGAMRWCGQWHQHFGRAVSRFGASGFLLPQADNLPTQLVHSNGVESISFISWRSQVVSRVWFLTMALTHGLTWMKGI